MERRVIRCFAEGSSGSWEAFCVDFDLAVQGPSFEDVHRKLNEQIALYIESVLEMPAPDRERLLNRSMPLAMKINFMLRYLTALMGNRSRLLRHDYTQSIPDLAQAA